MSLLDTLRISLAGLVVGAIAIGGCSEGHDSHDGADHVDHSEVDEHAGHDHGGMDSDVQMRTDVYEGVIGEIKFIPEAGDTKLHPKIRHVQIPTFKKMDGKVAMSPDGVPGMKSMTMEFPLGEGVSLDGYAVGDKVRFSFEAHWGERVSWEITAIEKLDPAMEIDFANVKAEP